MNKRGFLLNLVEIFSLLMLLIGSIIVIIYMTASFINFSSDSFATKASIFATNAIMSPNTLSYTDPSTGHTYPGVIDVKRISATGFQAELEKFFKYNTENKDLGARITIYDSSDQFNQVIKIQPPSVKFLETELSASTMYNLILQKPIVLYVNKLFFERWSVLAMTKYSGPGGAEYHDVYYNVLTLHDDGKTYNGVVFVEVVGRD